MMMDKLTAIYGLQLNAIQSSEKGNLTKSESNTNASPINFKDMFQHAIQKVDQSQKTATHLTNQLISGEVDDLHKVMIAGEKANVSLQLTVQVRNKIIDSYEEIMRMQI